LNVYINVKDGSVYYCLLFAVTHAPFHVSSADAYSWPSARDRRDRKVNYLRAVGRKVL